ncbi:hypothetical protein VT84_16350 [Gemmata sp. SH-PL17]|uniref:hypothetical protein n=1 Tax=Gemmata sp. SH-PL17 TaxID=1630693 RepID=UPI0004B3C6E5|nr:hypothetical protein [Gemmata sp. SH-PL17]AMV25971.1 hypothetical protein VT84_16350 [Gemmata sp. SH-PL17]
MSSVPVPARAPRAGVLSVIDWRTVAAIGLPLWAFLAGAIVMRPSTPAGAVFTGIELIPHEFPPPSPGPSTDEPIPMPREIVVRTEVVTVPVVVPVVTPGEPVVVAQAPPEFRLPVSELMPAERCQSFNTKVRFHPGMTEAAEEAKASKKMMLVLHISGHFDDPGFT